MPRNAIENVRIDAVGTAKTLARLMTEFANRSRGFSALPVRVKIEHSQPSLFLCPACGGVLSQLENDDVVRFRCRTGHAYSPLALFTEQEAKLETALWMALRALVERADLSARSPNGRASTVTMPPRDASISTRRPQTRAQTPYASR